MTYHINLETVSEGAFTGLLALDKTFVGTGDYMGLASFWATAYKFTMRACSVANCKRVHQMLISRGLAVHEESDAHWAVIKKYAKPRSF